MIDHLSLYKGFGSFFILAFTSSSARCSTTRVILAMIFSLSLQRLSCSRKSYHWWQVGIRSTSSLPRGASKIVIKPARSKRPDEQDKDNEPVHVDRDINTNDFADAQ